MTQEQIPADIQADADRLYPINPQYEEGGIANMMNRSQQALYIKGRMDERLKYAKEANNRLSINEVYANAGIELPDDKHFIPVVGESVEEPNADNWWANNWHLYDTSRELTIAAVKFGSTWANQQAVSPTVKIEHFPHPEGCTNCEDMPTYYAFIPSMRGMAESANSPQDALYELMLSLEVKFAYEHNIPLSDKRLKQAVSPVGGYSRDDMKNSWKTGNQNSGNGKYASFDEWLSQYKSIAPTPVYGWSDEVWKQIDEQYCREEGCAMSLRADHFFKWLKTHQPQVDPRVEEMHKWLGAMTGSTKVIDVYIKFKSLFPPTKTTES